MTPRRNFIALWTVAVFATSSAFVVHLALRGKIVSGGYELGRAHAEQKRLLEMRQAARAQVATYKNPDRVDVVARSLLGMEPPPSDRIIVLPADGHAERHALAKAFEGAPP